MSVLPFLNKNKLPKLRTLGGTSMYGFSEDDEMSESAIDELLQAFESKDYKKLMSALKALVGIVRNKHASDAHEDSSIT